MCWIFHFYMLSLLIMAVIVISKTVDNNIKRLF